MADYYYNASNNNPERQLGLNGAPYVQQVAINPTVITATIANAASLSPAIDLAGKALVGIHMPTAWTTANLTFQVSEDGVAYDDYYDSLGTEVTVSATASRYIKVFPADWVGVRFIKVRSGISAAPIAQGAVRTIQLITKVV